MNETREQFREMMGRRAFEAFEKRCDEIYANPLPLTWDELDKNSKACYRDEAEAVYAEALRDMADLLDDGSGETYVFPRLVIEKFAGERGITLEGRDDE